VLSKDCPKCNIRKCVVPKNCEHGLVPDACDCCPVCGNAKGDRCGGPNGEWGNCGEGMKCFFDGSDAIENKDGKCT